MITLFIWNPHVRERPYPHEKNKNKKNLQEKKALSRWCLNITEFSIRHFSSLLRRYWWRSGHRVTDAQQKSHEILQLDKIKGMYYELHCLEDLEKFWIFSLVWLAVELVYNYTWKDNHPEINYKLMRSKMFVYVLWGLTKLLEILTM